MPINLPFFHIAVGHNEFIISALEIFFLHANPVTLQNQETIKGTERASPIYALFHR